jgi:hypothetical protein
LAESQQQSQEKIHAGNNAATIKAAEISAQGRVDAAKARVDAAKREAKTPTELITRLLLIPPEQRDTDWDRAYTEANAAAKADAIRRQPQVGPNLINGGQAPTVDSATAEAEQAARARKGAQAAPQPQAQGLSKQEVEAAGKVYEPGYIYIKDPATGKIIRGKQ